MWLIISSAGRNHSWSWTETQRTFSLHILVDCSLHQSVFINKLFTKRLTSLQYSLYKSVHCSKSRRLKSALHVRLTSIVHILLMWPVLFWKTTSSLEFSNLWVFQHLKWYIWRTLTGASVLVTGKRCGWPVTPLPATPARVRSCKLCDG